MQKGIASIIFVIIIIVLLAVAGFFAYQYFTKPQTPITNVQPNNNIQNQQVVNQPTITITSPTLRYGWAQGSTQNITWTSTGVKTISIDIVKGFGAPVNGSNLIPIASYISASSGSYSWVIPLTIPVGEPYNIQISDKDSGYTDIVANTYPISILIAPSIKVISPKGGETWQIGTTQTIKYSTIGIGPAGTCVDVLAVDPNGNKIILSQSTYIGPGERDGITVKPSLPGKYKVELDAHYCAETNNAFIASGLSADYITITK